MALSTTWLGRSASSLLSSLPPLTYPPSICLPSLLSPSLSSVNIPSFLVSYLPPAPHHTTSPSTYLPPSPLHTLPPRRRSAPTRLPVTGNQRRAFPRVRWCRLGRWGSVRCNQTSPTTNFRSPHDQTHSTIPEFVGTASQGGAPPPGCSSYRDWSLDRVRRGRPRWSYGSCIDTASEKEWAVGANRARAMLLRAVPASPTRGMCRYFA